MKKHQTHSRLINIGLVVVVIGISVLGIATAILFRINGDRTGEFAAASAPPETSCISSSKACAGSGCWCGSQYAGGFCNQDSQCRNGWCRTITCYGSSSTTPQPTNPPVQSSITPTPTCKNNGTVVSSQSQCCSKYGQSITGGFICAANPVTPTPTISGARCGAGFTDGDCGGRIWPSYSSNNARCTANQRACIPPSDAAATCISDPLCIQANPSNIPPTTVPIVSNTPAPTQVASNPGARATNNCGYVDEYIEGVCNGVKTLGDVDSPAAPRCLNNTLACYPRAGGQALCLGDNPKCAVTPTPTPHTGVVCGFNYEDGGCEGPLFPSNPSGEKCEAGKFACYRDGTDAAAECRPKSICPTPTTLLPDQNPDPICGEHFDFIDCELPDQYYGCPVGTAVCYSDFDETTVNCKPNANCANQAATSSVTAVPTESAPSAAGETGFIPSGAFSAANLVFASTLGATALLIFIIVSSLFGITILVYQAVTKKN